MRKLVQASGAILLSGASTTMAAGIDASFGEARLYWRASFGENTQHPAAMQYGMSLDYDRSYLKSELPPAAAAQVNFDLKGFANASLNGVPFTRRVTLQQAEGEAAAGTSYTIIDYSLLAIGAAGIGYGISEVVNQKDTPDAARPGTPPGTPPAQPPAGPSLPMPSGGPALPMPSGGPAIPGRPLAGGYGLPEERAVTPEYQQWLDAGTGGMGDLLLIKE